MSSIKVFQTVGGATVLIEEMPGVRSAAFSWLVPGGSADDPEHSLGRAAMWAELLMRGDDILDSRAQADAFDMLGCARSVSVGAYFMSLGGTCMGSKLPDAVQLLSRMLLAPRMDDDAIEPARDLCVQALESLKDDPQERSMHAARERHHPTPLNRHGMGTAAGLASLTSSALRTQWKQTATPARSILAFAGAVSTDAINAALTRSLQGWSGDTPEPKPVGTPPRGYGHITDPSNQVQIIVAHDAPPESHPDSMLEKVLVSVLSGGMSGRLFSEVREKRGLCYSVSASYRADRDSGTVTGYVGTTPERAQQSLDCLFEQFLHIGTPAGVITQDEFDRAVVGMKARLVFAGESTGARAGALATDFHRLGRARTLDEIASQIDRVSLGQLNDYARRRLLGRTTIQTLGPAALSIPSA